jgi:uncharacterized protein YkwD
MFRKRSRIQSRAAALAAATILATSLLGASISAAPGYSPDNQELAFLELINEYRAQNGLGTLVLQEELGAAAEYHSADMANNNYFDHYLSDGSGPGDNIRQHGYSGDVWGENIAAGMSTAPEALVGWQNSPGHNAAMLDPGYTEIGIGRYYSDGSEFGWYWTTTFGGGEDDVSPATDSRQNRPATNRGDGSGTVTTTVNGVPIEGDAIVNADGRVITTIDRSGAAPIERTTTITQEPSVIEGEWVDPNPAPATDTWDGGDTYGPAAASETWEGEDTYAAEASETWEGEDTYAAGAPDSWEGGDTYTGSDTYAADTYGGGGGDYIEAQQEGVIEPPTINGVPVESGTYVADGSTVSDRGGRRSNANGDGPTVVYGDINPGEEPTSINADGGYNTGATTSAPSGGASSDSASPSSTTTNTSPDGSMTTTTTINGITMDDGVSTTYGNSRGRGASATPGEVTYGN